MKRVLLEGILVALAGMCLALAANALSPRGLKLSRDYFPGSLHPHGPSTATSPGPTNITTAPVVETLASRLQAKGLRLADNDQVFQLFNDPRVQQNLVVFIDARNDEHYEAGHIPGAYPFDYYHPEKQITTVLPACQVAQQVVVYCNGGECEDSELVATLLSGAGIPAERILVYGGGFPEWEKSSRPVETGPRNSGVIRNAAK